MSAQNVRPGFRVQPVVGTRRADKLDRLEKVNALLAVIAGCGRRFFHHKGRISRMRVDDRGRVWFWDSYSQKEIYTHCETGRWRGFTNGGTLRSLVCGLRDYIASGDASGVHLGPWPDTFCDGDLWGYGASMATVQAQAVQSGIARSNAQAQPTACRSEAEASGSAGAPGCTAPARGNGDADTT